jgi:phosphoenolpyruvate-protein phosphotransferase (PTS system enzyme I)
MELKGTGVSPGIAVGQALLVDHDVAPVFRLLVPPEDIEAEVVRLTHAIEASAGQLQAIKDRMSREVGVPHAYIFDAHLLMLEDPLLRDRAVAVIREENVNAEWALRMVAEQLHALFDAFQDQYLRERSTDLDDVLGRIQLNLAGAAGAPSLSRLPGRFVVVAVGLSPSEAAGLDWERVVAIATDVGSSTYHTAIIARSLGIPAVVGLENATRRIPPGTLVVVDGTRGRVVIEPSGPFLASLRETQEREESFERRLQETHALPAVTLDGTVVKLRANVEFIEEVAAANLSGALGIGLFRSEYLLGRSRRWPTEEQQVELYRRLLEQMAPHPVTVRTWDVGLDEMAPGGPTSPNPALGERALRLLRRFPDPFRLQVRALLRARAHGLLRVMFPFASGPSDLYLALQLIEDAKAELRREGQIFGEDLEVGLTIEVPSAALTADLLAKHLDFLSIGTNDLIQYLLAVDRADTRVSALYQPLHPAVLRIIHHVLQTAGKKLPVSVCGEMASHPLHALLLVGLGVRELSMAPSAIPRVKAALRAVRLPLVEAVANACLDLDTEEAVEQRLREELQAALTAAETPKD